MVLRVGERQAFRRLRDQPDQALVGAHRGQVHRLAVQPLGGVEFELGIGAQHVDRAHLGDHVGGDVHHDAVEARLGADRLRHHLAEPAEQQTGSAVGALHGPDPDSPRLAMKAREDDAR